MSEQAGIPNDQSTDADRICRCLSMVIHHEEVKLMVDVIKELLDKQSTEDAALKEM